jgi:septal ring factor EnvC (AmiA/AmiB activator)
MITRHWNLEIKNWILQMLSFLQNKKCVWVLLLIELGLSSHLMAKDISHEQYQVRMAQKEYDSANRDHQVLADSIKEFEKRIAQQSQQLETLKKGLPAKEDRLNRAQKALEEKQVVLDKAWEENKK